MSEGERVGASLRGLSTQLELSIRHKGRKVPGVEGGVHTNAECILDEKLHSSLCLSDRHSAEMVRFTRRRRFVAIKNLEKFFQKKK
jgi:hypothetical protein